MIAAFIHAGFKRFLLSFFEVNGGVLCLVSGFSPVFRLSGCPESSIKSTAGFFGRLQRTTLQIVELEKTGAPLTASTGKHH